MLDLKLPVSNYDVFPIEMLQILSFAKNKAVN